MEAFMKGIQIFSELRTFLQISFRHGKMTIYGVLIVIIMLCYTDCNPTSTCNNSTSPSGLESAVELLAKVKSTLPAGSAATSTCEEKMAECYLESAIGMIKEVKSAIPANSSCGNITTRAIDCSELLQMGHTQSGVYTICPRDSAIGPIKVYCDMQTTGGGWTLIQRRGNFQNDADYFYKDWKSYKEGFGDLEKEFWLGNDNIHALTNQRLSSVRFDLKDMQNSVRYAEYSTFLIEDESQQYKLYFERYTGDAGDSLNDHNKMKFSTKDRDNDIWRDGSCAHRNKGAWWYREGIQSNLNGLNLRGRHEVHWEGINWNNFRGDKESLESTEIKIRPKYINSHNVYKKKLGN